MFEPGKGYKIKGESGYFGSDGSSLQVGKVKAVEQGIPHGFAVLMLATITTVLWLPLRFSLRTLLIAMTLASALLGVLVWAAN